MPNENFVQFNPGSGQNRVAIVFVHGFSGDLQKTWGMIPAILESCGSLAGWDLFGFGYSSKKRFDLLGLWSADPALEQISTSLLTTLLDKNHKIAFVAHSMGGLVVQRALVMSEQLRSRTTHVTLFGTPSNGLEKAGVVSWLKQQAHDMAQGGPFVTALRHDWTALDLDTKFDFLTVAGEMDQFVDPPSSLDPFPKSFQRVIPGNHLSMLEAESVDAPCVKLILQNLTKEAAGEGVRSAASAAVDAGDFQALIEILWPVRSKLDDAGAVQLAIALDRKGRRDEAIELLREIKPTGTDVLGVLAGRLKRRWLITHDRDDFASAFDLYRKGYETSIAKNDHAQAYYHGINLAYMALAGSDKDVPEAKLMAQNALDQCALADKSFWSLATEGDALVILGKWKEGFEKHRQAVAIPELRAWQALSMEEQALRVAELSGVSRNDAGELVAIYEGSQSLAQTPFV